jgi:hypothetical protein
MPNSAFVQRWSSISPASVIRLRHSVQRPGVCFCASTDTQPGRNAKLRWTHASWVAPRMQSGPALAGFRIDSHAYPIVQSQQLRVARAQPRRVLVAAGDGTGGEHNGDRNRNHFHSLSPSFASTLTASMRCGRSYYMLLTASALGGCVLTSSTSKERTPEA